MCGTPCVVRRTSTCFARTSAERTSGVIGAVGTPRLHAAATAMTYDEARSHGRGRTMSRFMHEAASRALTPPALAKAHRDDSDASAERDDRAEAAHDRGHDRSGGRSL